jgi:hypothetical protein
VVTSYPVSGYRHTTSGVFTNTGIAGDYWSYATTGASAYYLTFGATTVSSTGSVSRAYAFPVRCVQYFICFEKRIRYLRIQFT